MAKVLAISVFPTPVGPKNRKDPIGLFGLFIPVRDLFITEDMASIALSCPIIFSCKIFSKLRREDFSVSKILLVGIPVQFDNITAMSSSVTFLFSK